VLPLDVWSEPINPKVDNSEAIVEKPEAAPPAKQAASPSKPETKPEPKQQTAKAKSEPKPEASTKAAIPSGASGWVVQVASFSDQPKAFTLRDRLRKAGHPAFVERAHSGAGATIYRVKVGPVLQRTEADRLKQQVDKETKLNSLVMKYR
jgi:DedD protein